MCFTKEISIRSFGLGLISGTLLIFFGNNEHKNFNCTIGIFFMFVSLMQYIEYLMWNDLECNKSQNKVATAAGPLLNHLQPTILFLLTIYFLTDISQVSKIVIRINIMYMLYVFYKYYNFMNNKKEKCTKKKDVHLDWLWKHDFNYIIYQIVMVTNVFVFGKDLITLSPFIISYILFFYYLQNDRFFVGELWCYSVNSVPLFTLLLQNLI
jgi:hypothetical protein